MRTATIRTNETCNERCGFCHARADADDPARFSRQAIIDAATTSIAAGAKEIVFTGGEPLLRDDLMQIVGAVIALGVNHVVVESNGLLLAYQQRADALAATGIHTVRIAINAWASESDAITQRPGGFELTCRGVDNALRAGLQVELSCALHADNLGAVAELPRLFAERFDTIACLRLHLVTEAPAPHLAPLEQLVQASLEVIDACRDVGIRCEVAPTSTMSPCLVPRRRQYPELLRPLHDDRGGGRAPVSACQQCVVNDVCGGLRPEFQRLAGDIQPRPVQTADERFVRAAGADRSAKASQQLLSSGHYIDGDGRVQDERVVRVNYHCNQDCTFCFVDRTLPTIGADRVMAEIDRAAHERVGLLSLSGGEPTLNPQLCAYIEHASGRGLRVQIQTNAVMLDDLQFTQQLVTAGLDEAFVSLHGASAEVSDNITRRPGTFERSLHGIDNLIASGVEVRLNCVVTGDNVPSLSALADLIATRFRNVPELVLSWASASTDLVPVSADITPKTTTTLTTLTALIDRCEELGVRWRGFEGECGVPLCILPPKWVVIERIPTRPTRAPPPGFIKPQACAQCALDDRCPGLRETYAQLHTAVELRPLDSSLMSTR